MERIEARLSSLEQRVNVLVGGLGVVVVLANAALAAVVAVLVR